MRLAAGRDALRLSALAEQGWLDTHVVAGMCPATAEEVRRSSSVASLQAQIARPDTRVLLAEFNEHLIGFAQLPAQSPQAPVLSERPRERERVHGQRPFLG
ncbi:MAG: hypothetical protein JO006_18555 [Paucibacter sp.]|nr:hypothetical protein [Roseateles sp.]